MSTKECPHCGNTVFDNMVKCPKCKARLKTSGMGNLIKIIAIVALVVIAVNLVGSLFGGSSEPSVREPVPTSRPRATSAPETYTVVYRITGNANNVSLTLEDEDGGTVQRMARVPYDLTFDAEFGQFVYISAQSEDDAARNIECEITVNGEVVENARSGGRYTIVTCSGSVGR